MSNQVKSSQVLFFLYLYLYLFLNLSFHRVFTGMMCNQRNQVLYSAVESRIRAGGLKHKSTKGESGFVPNWASFTKIVSPFIFLSLFVSVFLSLFEYVINLYLYQKHNRGIWLCAQLGKFHQGCVTIHFVSLFLSVFEFFSEFASVFVCVYLNKHNKEVWFSALLGWFHKTEKYITNHICVHISFAFWIRSLSSFASTLVYFYQKMMIAQLTVDCNKTALGEHHLPSKRPQPPPPPTCILHTSTAIVVGSRC